MDLFTRKCAHNRILKRFESCDQCIAFERAMAIAARGPANPDMVIHDLCAAGGVGPGELSPAHLTGISNLSRDVLLRWHFERTPVGALVAEYGQLTVAHELLDPYPREFLRWGVHRSECGLEFEVAAEIGGSELTLAESLITDTAKLSCERVASTWSEIERRCVNLTEAAEHRETHELRALVRRAHPGMLACKHGMNARVFEPPPRLDFHNWLVFRTPGGLVFEAHAGPGPCSLRARHDLLIADPARLERYHIAGAWSCVEWYLKGGGGPYSGGDRSVASEMVVSRPRPRFITPADLGPPAGYMVAR